MCLFIECYGLTSSSSSLFFFFSINYETFKLCVLPKFQFNIFFISNPDGKHHPFLIALRTVSWFFFFFPCLLLLWLLDFFVCLFVCFVFYVLVVVLLPLTCLFSSSHPLAPGMSVAADQSIPRGSALTCTPPPISRIRGPALVWRHARGCHSGKVPSWRHRPGSSRWVNTGTGCCHIRARRSSGLECAKCHKGRVRKWGQLDTNWWGGVGRKTTTTRQKHSGETQK